MVVCCKNNAHFSKEAKGVKSVAVRIWHKRMRLHMTHAELWQYLSCSKTIVLLYWDSCVTWYINLMSHMECTRSYISIYTQLPINIFPLEWLKNKAKICIASLLHYSVVLPDTYLRVCKFLQCQNDKIMLVTCFCDIDNVKLSTNGWDIKECFNEEYNKDIS